MKTVQFYITLVLGGVALLLAGMTVLSARSNKELQEEVQAQAQKINQGRQAARMHQSILSDLAKLSLNNAKINTLLNQHGYKVEFTPEEIEAEEGESANAASPSTSKPTPAAGGNRRTRKP